MELSPFVTSNGTITSALANTSRQARQSYGQWEPIQSARIREKMVASNPALLAASGLVEASGLDLTYLDLRGGSPQLTTSSMHVPLPIPTGKPASRRPINALGRRLMLKNHNSPQVDHLKALAKKH
ncbi:hypothetical protein S40288_10734 [Stachybotrys chartarum IBT 40288]|nr:hypothetical protein S40288_10734 [Stachybotrys chartarum IBT 40288]